jgi:hypothetical protein
VNIHAIDDRLCIGANGKSKTLLKVCDYIMAIEAFRLSEIIACVNYAILSHASLYMSMDYNMAHYAYSW